MQVLAKADAAEEWERLSDKEQQVYVAMAQGEGPQHHLTTKFAMLPITPYGMCPQAEQSIG